MTDNPALTREVLEQAFLQMRQRDEREFRARAERAREVAARGPYRSTLGRMIDSMYISNGPIVVNPKVARLISERLERDERATADPKCTLPYVN